MPELCDPSKQSCQIGAQLTSLMLESIGGVILQGTVKVDTLDLTTVNQ